ncbi:MAG: amidase [Gammaproteobacteria bacterium]|nr:amidase [Gammaproteobacteria bacterium]
MTDLMRLGVAEQARLLRRGEVSPAEMVDAAIAAIERQNPALNAVVQPMYDVARRALRDLRGDEPYGGVPLLLKDMCAEYGGTPLREGSRFLDGYVSPHDSELVARLRRAGFIVVGKTNTPEFASKPTTESELYGPARNPWDLTRSPGGSSGGAGAAVAAGMVAVAHANDGGGSTRIPASVCGLVGLKATRGRNPLGPDLGDAGGAGLISEHVVTRSVLDTALLLDVTAGPDLGAPHFPPPPRRAWAAEVGTAPGRLRIAFSDECLTPTTVHPDCRRAVRDIAALCADLGHEVVEAKPEVDASRFNEHFTTLWLGMVGWMIRDWSQRLEREPAPEYFERHTWKMIQYAGELKAADFLLALAALQKLTRDIAPFFTHHDVWLTPTLPEPPVPLGWFDYDRAAPHQATERMERFPRFTAIANVTGQPAMSLPLCWNEAGLPIGIQIMGRFADEATLFRLAGQLEAARPWAQRWPRSA